MHCLYKCLQLLFLIWTDANSGESLLCLSQLITAPSLHCPPTPSMEPHYRAREPMWALLYIKVWSLIKQPLPEFWDLSEGLLSRCQQWSPTYPWSTPELGCLSVPGPSFLPDHGIPRSHATLQSAVNRDEVFALLRLWCISRQVWGTWKPLEQSPNWTLHLSLGAARKNVLLISGGLAYHRPPVSFSAPPDSQRTSSPMEMGDGGCRTWGLGLPVCDLWCSFQAGFSLSLWVPSGSLRSQSDCHSFLHVHLSYSLSTSFHSVFSENCSTCICNIFFSF